MKEYWKTITKYEDYSISTLGRVKSTKNGKETILKPFRMNNNYYVTLCKNGIPYNVRPCVVVLQEFIGLYKKRYTVKFADNDIKNCALSNIYVTNGIVHKQFLSVDEVAQVYLIHKNSGFDIDEISKRYKIDYGTVKRICDRKTCTYITDIIESYLD